MLKLILLDDYDTVYLAHCYPYTYTDLNRYIKSIEEDSFRKTKVRRKNLCQTIAGNKYRKKFEQY